MNAHPEEVGEVVTVARNAVVELDPFDRQLQEFRRRYDGVVYDLDDPKQNKQARSDRHTIGKVVAELDRRHKAVKEPLLEATRLLDGRRKNIKDGLLAIQGSVKRQIDAHEAIERDRIAALNARVESIRDLSCSAPGIEPASNLWVKRLAEVESIELDDSWQEKKA